MNWDIQVFGVPFTMETGAGIIVSNVPALFCLKNISTMENVSLMSADFTMDPSNLFLLPQTN